MADSGVVSPEGIWNSRDATIEGTLGSMGGVRSEVVAASRV